MNLRKKCIAHLWISHGFGSHARYEPLERLHRCDRRYNSSLQNVRERSRDNNLIFRSTSNVPYQNLAIEHSLLTNTDPASKILLFYTNRPCIVIGRNQNPWSECNLLLAQKEKVDIVRRRSGGGTVFHDAGNLNFSVIVPNDQAFDRKKHAEMVVRALKRSPSEDRIFEDVWVNDRHDIVIRRQDKQFKVSGSAFKLTRGRALHHGTILHSSPNLQDITKFLRSPGKDYIQARGVDSVRSPVSNLFNSREHQKLGSTITQLIIEEFKKLHGSAQEYMVGDESRHGEVANGANELMTTDWKFIQTPRFDFKGSQVDGKQITMSVNRGVIESASFSARPLLQEVSDWKSVIGDQPDKLLDQMARIFPYIGESARCSDEGTIIERNDQHLSRLSKDGTVEVEERGRNTVKQGSE